MQLWIIDAICLAGPDYDPDWISLSKQHFIGESVPPLNGVVSTLKRVDLRLDLAFMVF